MQNPWATGIREVDVRPDPAKLAGMGRILIFCGLVGLQFANLLHANDFEREDSPVKVPGKWTSSPFDSPRRLKIPAGASISVVARIEKARFLAVGPNGDLLVSQPSKGKILLVRGEGENAAVYEWVKGLNLPHSMVFHAVGQTLYLYVGEANEICRFRYGGARITATAREVIVPNLPNRSSPELGGAYGHELKNIAIGPDNKLYVAIASASNANPADTQSDPIRSAIYQYDLGGKNRRLVAKGIRNAEGLDFRPGTNELWVTVNNRDNIRFPFKKKLDGTGGSDLGAVLPAYVDDHPPDEFIHVKEGANYGWPFANPNPDHGLNNMPFDPDLENNRDWSRYPESSFTRIGKGLQAHSAALGFSFLQASNIPAPWKNGAAIAYHGSWNRTKKTGYKIVFFPWKADGEPGDQADLITGWLDEVTQSYWGRPVAVVPDLGGGLIVSDDDSGTIYRLQLPKTGSEK
jgi:glucose/arabinose dehydrogenase